MIDVARGVAWAAAAALSALIVLVGLAIVAAAFAQRKRDRALDLIIDGHEGVPVAAVQRERQRLHAPRTQRLLAGAIDGIVDQALNPPKIRGPGARRLFEIAVVASLAEDLRALSRLLRAEHAPRSVASRWPSVWCATGALRCTTTRRMPCVGNWTASTI